MRNPKPMLTSSVSSKEPTNLGPVSSGSSSSFASSLTPSLASSSSSSPVISSEVASNNPHAQRVTLLDKLIGSTRLTLLRYNLRALSWIARRFARRDPVHPHLKRSRCAGESLLIARGVSWPAPIPGLHFGALFQASARHVSSNATVLEVGAGSGVWSLCCLRRGAHVSATDLPEVDLSGLAESARRQGGQIETSSGDLFSAYQGERFDHVLFNPPFHAGVALNPAERAYFGGEGGEVTRRYLQEVSDYLTVEGIGWVILPMRERRLYQRELDALDVTCIARRWLPLLGEVSLLALRPLTVSDQSQPMRPDPRPHQLPMNVVSECFLQLSHLMNTHSCEVVTLRGALDEELMCHAIEEVTKRHVITRARLIEKKTKLGVSRGWTWVTQHPTPPPRYIFEELNDEERHELHEALDSEERWSSRVPRVVLRRVWERTALDPAEGPPVEWRLIKAGHLSLLLLIAPHLCTDAFAGALLMNEALETYHRAVERSTEEKSASLEPSGAPQHVSGSSTPHPYLIPDPLARFTRPIPKSVQEIRSLGSALRGISSDLFSAAGGVPKTLHHQARSSHQRGLTEALIYRVSRGELKEVLSGARRHGVKAHSLFTWGLVSALKSWSSRHQLKLAAKLRFVDLCALRPLVPAERGSDFDVLVQPYTRTLSPEWGAEETLRRLGVDLAHQKRTGVLVDLKRSALYAWVARWLPREWVTRLTFRGLLKTNLTTTNPGPALLKAQRAGEAEVVDFINFPQIAPPAELGIIYTSYRGELRIMTLYDENCWDEAQIRELVESLWSEVLISARA